MLCCICKEREATVHLTQIAAIKCRRWTCARNAPRRRESTIHRLFPGGPVLGLGASQEIEQASGGVEIKCGRCGFYPGGLQKAGRLGCPECYKDVCRGPGESAQVDAQRRASHRPKFRTHSARPAICQTRLKGLQKKLTKAVEDENFEQAPCCAMKSSR